MERPSSDRNISAGSAPTREILGPVLVRRYRLIAPLILIGTAAFGFFHVWVDEPFVEMLLWLKALQAAVVVAGLWFTANQSRRTVIAVALMLVVATFNAVTAVSSTLIEQPHTNVLILVSTALGTSSFLPWGAACQAVMASSAWVAGALPLLMMEGGGTTNFYDLVAMAVALAISIYIAREVETDTLSEYRSQAATMALAESRADFEGLFRSSNVLLAIATLTDDDFIYTDVNPALAQLFSLSPEAVRGMTGRELGFPEERIEQWRSIFQRCAVEGTVEIPEYRLVQLAPDRYFRISFSTIHDPGGQAVRFAGVGVDISELKAAEERVRNLNPDLEQQVRDRTALLAAANKDLESFAYSVSHDLRTPLRTIEGFAAMLEDEYRAALPPDAAGMLDRIRSASQHMARLIDDILRLSRAGRSEMHPETLDLGRLCADIIRELRSADPQRNTKVRIAEHLTIHADPVLIRVVMDNLLNNAWKYSRERENSLVEVGLERGDGRDVFFVRDNGCGFDMRFVEKLFQPFQRLHTAEEFEGTGIGLATVARIIARHGGEVWAESEVDRGTTVRFTIAEDALLNPS